MEDGIEIEEIPHESADGVMDISSPEENHYFPLWNDLPSIPMQRIYSFVNAHDRTNMSLVCKQWSKDFGAPCNWTRMQFQFPDRHSPFAMLIVLKFAERYAHLFRHVEIVCGRVSTGLLEQSTSQLRQFCEILAQSSRLKSLRVENLKSIFRWTEHSLRNDVIDALKILLKSQKSLETLEFSFTHFKKSEALDILGSVGRNKSLKEIRLKRFIYEQKTRDSWSDTDSDQEGNNVNINPISWISDCTDSLKVWAGDYNTILEGVILNFPSMFDESNWTHGYSKWTGALQKISITCESWVKEICHGISPEAWKQFRVIFPELRMDLTIHSSSAPKSMLEFFVVKNMPLRYLHYSATSGPRSQFLTTQEFFHYLVNCGVHTTLEELHLLWEIGGSEDIMMEMSGFIRNCRSLKTIVIQMTWPFEFHEEMLTSWIESRPQALETVFLTVTHMPSEELSEELFSQAQSYSPTIQALGITFALVLELSQFR